MSEDRYVFGISVDPIRDRAFGFVRADAIAEERRLRTGFDPLEEFPTEGNIYVPEAFLPDTDTGAIWRVRRSSVLHSGPRHSEWSAVGRGVPGPLEVISLPLSSSYGNRIRQQLIDGIDLGYTPASQVLIRLLDTVIVGPVEGTGYEQEGTYGFASNSEAFAEPLRVWDMAHLDTFQVEAPYAIDGRRRTFACDLDLPHAQRWIDLADFGVSVRSILKPLASGERRILTSGLLRQITTELRKDDYPEAIRERVNRVRRAVQSLALTTEELEGLMPAVLADAQVAKGIQSARQDAAEEERKRIANEKQGAIDEIRQLREQEKQLRERIEGLSHEVVTVGDSVREVADAAVTEVCARVDQAMNNAAKLLADVAVLRPFLGTGSSLSSESRERIDAPVVLVKPIRVLGDMEEVEEGEPATAADLATRLTDDLKTSGIAPNTARLLAREVIAALLAGQVPVLTGSFANAVTDVLARALAGRRALLADIPLGLVSDSPLHDAVDVATRAIDGLQPIFVLRGIDRSAVEVYGGVLRETVSKRVLAKDFEEMPLAFIASACGGPACIPIGPGVFDIGPVIDTDLLKYSKKGGGQAPLRRAISLVKWSQWRTELACDHQEVQADTRRACIELSVAVSMLWRKGAESAAAFLASLGGQAESETAESILSRWVVPRALAEGLNPDEIASRLNALGIDDQLIQGGEGAEPPVAALLERARRILEVCP